MLGPYTQNGAGSWGPRLCSKPVFYSLTISNANPWAGQVEVEYGPFITGPLLLIGIPEPVFRNSFYIFETEKPFFSKQDTQERLS